MPNLYELTEQYRMLEEAAYNDELTVEEFDRMLNEIEGDIEEKVDGYCKVLRNMAADVRSLSTEEKRIKARRQSIESNMDRMKAVLANAMDAQGRRSVKTPLFTLYFAQNSHVEITDLAAVPEEYLKQRPRKEDDINKKAIADYIKETGEILPFARMVAGRSLNIR